jgi:hypothetical protein
MMRFMIGARAPITRQENKIMKKLLAQLLLLAPVIGAQAQDHTHTKTELDRVFEANKFAKTLMKSAAPAGKTLTGSLRYVNDRQQWYCSIDVRGDGAKASVTESDATSPERACVQAILQLSKQRVI